MKQTKPNDAHILIISTSSVLMRQGTSIVERKNGSHGIDKYTSSNTSQFMDRYILQDHATGVVYFEYYRKGDPVSVAEFLHRSWSPKIFGEYSQFMCGKPKRLVIPDSITNKFAITNFLSDSDVKPVSPATIHYPPPRIVKEIESIERKCLISNNGILPVFFLNALIPSWINAVNHTWYDQGGERELMSRGLRYIAHIINHGYLEPKPYKLTGNNDPVLRIGHLAAADDEKWDPIKYFWTQRENERTKGVESSDQEEVIKAIAGIR